MKKQICLWQKIFDVSECLHNVGANGRSVPLELTLAQARILDMLFRRTDRDFRLKDLAGALHLTPGAVSQTVTELARYDLVERRVAENDRRALYIRVTDKSVRLRQQYCGTLEAFLQNCLKDLPQEDVETFDRILTVLEQKTREHFLQNAGAPEESEEEKVCADRG